MGEERKTLFALREDKLNWLEYQLTLINEGKLSELDYEEIQFMLQESINDLLDSIESQMERMQTHMLKWKYQPSRQTDSWVASIVGGLREIERKCKRSKSLKKRITKELMLDGYKVARRWASTETGLDIKKFPQMPEWTLEQLLSLEFIEKWVDTYRK